MSALFAMILLLAAPHAQGDSHPKIGPELEFRGKRHYPAVACAVTVYPKGEKSVMNLSALTMTVFIPPTILTTSLRSPGQDEEIRDDKLVIAGQALGFSGVGAGSLGIWYSLTCPAIRSAANRAYDTKLEAALKKLCQDGHCQLSATEVKNWWDPKSFRDFTVTYPDNYQVFFTHDSAVTEVKTSPMPLADLARRRELLQRDVYDLLKGIGLRPPRFDGPWNGGHLHWDLRESFTSPRHVRNFLVDLYNNRELTQGLLVDDPIEAGHPFDVDGGQKFRDAISILDEEFNWEPQDLAAKRAWHQNFVKKLRSLGIERYLHKGTGIHVNAQLGTLEIRSLRSPKTADSFERVARLLGSRIAYVGRQAGLIPIREHSAERPSRAARLDFFRNYVREAGESVDDMLPLVPGAATMRVNDAISGCMHFFRGLVKN